MALVIGHSVETETPGERDLLRSPQFEDWLARRGWKSEAVDPRISVCDDQSVVTNCHSLRLEILNAIEIAGYVHPLEIDCIPESIWEILPCR